MHIEIVERLPAKPPVLVIGAHAGRQLTPFAASLDKRQGGILRRAMQAGRFTGERDQHLDFVAPGEAAGRRLILVGLGRRQDLAALTAEEIGGRIENILAALGEDEAAIALDLHVRLRFRPCYPTIAIFNGRCREQGWACGPRRWQN